ncbi:PREDICTED: phenylethanolamine N-methyltransferase isoform X1 [Chinchilla lanigera]|uniref:phenylethanolamine N-methyltransferase isoform X1 n=1 Tax=Chinchilla lanigera TaxID=34839 RepID=UPI00038EED97|nr:PREDICTED: phenylethanolamine N-methyltransferase isoform X1 [Chinchilla lanigera]
MLQMGSDGDAGGTAGRGSPGAGISSHNPPWRCGSLDVERGLEGPSSAPEVRGRCWSPGSLVWSDPGASPSSQLEGEAPQGQGHQPARHRGPPCACPGEVTGRTLIDIGSGPTVYQLLSACAHFEDITMTDFLDVNRRELGRWLREEPEAFDWSAYSWHACLMEGRGESWQEKERQLRARVKRVLPIDVHQPQPLGTASPAPLPADALVSAFCLEAVSPDLASFHRALGHVTTLLKPGGHLLLIGGLEESWYQAGEVRLGVVPVSAGMVREALVRGGYEVRDLRTYTMPAHLRTGVDDVQGVFFAWAQKKAGVAV